MSPASVQSTTMKYWKKKKKKKKKKTKKTNATFGIDKKGLVQVALLQIRGGNGSHLRLLVGSLIGVSSVHFFLVCSVRKSIFLFSLVLLRGWAFLCQLIHLDALLLGPVNLRVANLDMLNLVGSDREFHQNSF